MVTLPAAPLDFSDISEVASLQLQALDSFQIEILSAKNSGTLDVSRYSFFLGLNSSEILSRFDFLRKESEYHAVSTLLARLEAEIKADFRSRALDTLFQRPGEIPLKQMLDTWKRVKPDRLLDFMNFENALDLRHWLAHGRNYTVNIAQAFTLQDIYTIVQAVHSVVSSFP